MFRRHRSFFVLALMLVVVVTGGGLLHSLIPHNHGAGDDHSGQAGESIIWQIFHAALKHDDKKALFAQLEPLMLVVLSIILLNRLNGDHILREREFADPRTHDRARTRALRRGILKYRAFG